MTETNDPVKLARRLAEHFHALPEVQLPAYQGQAPSENALLELRKQGAKLVALLQAKVSTDMVSRQLKELEGSLRVAQLFNVVSDKEFDSDIDSINKISDLVADNN